MKNILITAHSGCEGTPDNSMESILKGAALGADCVEIDIRADAQGNLWLTHDEPQDVSALVPLKEALDAIAKSGIAVNCDLKQEELLYPVLEAAEAAGIARNDLIFSGSVNVSLLRQDPSIVQRARIFLNLEQLIPHLSVPAPRAIDEAPAFIDAHLDEIAALVKELGVECINLYYRLMTDARISRARALGIELSLWTVNDEADQEWLMSKDLINMTTRSVTSAMRIRSEVRGSSH